MLRWHSKEQAGMHDNTMSPAPLPPPPSPPQRYRVVFIVFWGHQISENPTVSSTDWHTPTPTHSDAAHLLHRYITHMDVYTQKKIWEHVVNYVNQQPNIQRSRRCFYIYYLRTEHGYSVRSQPRIVRWLQRSYLFENMERKKKKVDEQQHTAAQYINFMPMPNARIIFQREIIRKIIYIMLDIVIQLLKQCSLFFLYSTIFCFFSSLRTDWDV